MKIFVYGTLRKGASAFSFYLAEPSTEFIGQATIHGDLHDMGWYPAVVNAGQPSAGTVIGDVFDVNEETLDRLDNYEGYPVLYERATVKTLDGAVVQTYVFVDKHGAQCHPKVEGGDWLNHAVGERG